MEDDELEAARIRALLGEIEGQRARGELAFAAAPLRLFGVGGGRFVRVLDAHEEALSPRSLGAIAAFLGSRGPSGGALANDTAAASDESAAAMEDVEDSPGLVGESVETDGPVGGEGESSRQQEEDVEMTSDIEEKVDSPTEQVKVDTMAETVADPTDKDKASVNEMEDRGVVLEREQVPRVTATPKELHERRVQVADWFRGGNRDSEQFRETPVDTDVHEASRENPSANVETTIDHKTLWTGWPAHLRERRRVWFEALPHPATVSQDRPVVYWVQNCYRVAQSNFSLETAVLLAQRLNAPLMLVNFVRSTVIYPVRHAQTANDAYLRWSLLEMQDQCAQANVAFYSITADEVNGASTATSGHPDGPEWQRNQLVAVLDAFRPHVVVTDTPFDVTSAGDMIRVAQRLAFSRPVSPWSLISVDSSSYVPVHNLSLRARGSLEKNVSFLSEEEFGHEYAAVLAQSGDKLSSAVATSHLLQKVMGTAAATEKTPVPLVSGVLQAFGLELVDWVIVRGMAAESSSKLPTFTERAGLKALNTLLAEFDGRPAIQAELQGGGGVMSLIPYVRQGSLFSGYVIQRIAEAIDFFPAPVTAQDRKALATLKVMRSRAVSHLAKERDYALYLALWSANRHATVDSDLPAMQVAHLTTSSALISSLAFSAAITTPLDAYAHLLPSWVDNSVRLAQIASSTSATNVPEISYDPYELESARTQDAYWNAIQRFFVRHQYLHPLLVVYWGYRVMQWAVSVRAGIAMIDALVSQCAVGVAQSPDAVFMIWNALFLRVERSRADGASSSSLLTGDPRAFQRALELELASQPKLELP